MSDPAVEAAAKAHCEFYDLTWDELPAEQQDRWRAVGRVVLAAADGARQAQTGDLRGELAAVRAELVRWGWGDMHYGTQPQEQSVVDAVARLDAVLARLDDGARCARGVSGRLYAENELVPPEDRGATLNMVLVVPLAADEPRHE